MYLSSHINKWTHGEAGYCIFNQLNKHLKKISAESLNVYVE